MFFHISNLKRFIFSGDISEPVKKKLKTVDAQETKKDETQEAAFNEKDDAEMYQHIHEAKETTTQVQINLFTLNYVSYYDVYRFLMLQRKIKPTNRKKKKYQTTKKKPQKIRLNLPKTFLMMMMTSWRN